MEINEHSGNGKHPRGVVERPVEEIMGEEDLTLLAGTSSVEDAEDGLKSDREGFGFLVSHKFLDFLLRREQRGSKVAWFITIGVGTAGIAYITGQRFLRFRERKRGKDDSS